MGRYFGTDGIRGVAGTSLTVELAARVGRAAAVVLARRHGEHPLFVIGRDTRLSGPMLQAALVDGITSAGGRVQTAGVIPTPGLAALVLHTAAQAGVVVSASHNPYEDNGIKFFGPEGLKLSDEEEAEIEELIDTPQPDRAGGTEPGAVEELEGAVERYVDDLVARIPVRLNGLRLAVDCANGATYLAAPRGLRAAGAEVTVLACGPDGVNINDGCGSTHLGLLQRTVSESDFDLGLAFDGDGDRVLAVDRFGGVVDGDFIIAILARHLMSTGRLRNNTVVTTVMTNLGFRLAMQREGIQVVTTDVGDRSVMQEMLRGDHVLGGEQSGHIINREVGTTGDGLATTLLLLQALQQTGAQLHEAAKIMSRLPQLLVNVPVRDLTELAGAEPVWAAVEEESRRLDGVGRVLVRPSGTEPLVRVMVEAPTEQECVGACERLVAVVREHLG
jgi:phosphoglucosamine mutase